MNSLWNYFTQCQDGGTCSDCYKIIKCNYGSTRDLATQLNIHPKTKQRFEEVIAINMFHVGTTDMRPKSWNWLSKVAIKSVTAVNNLIELLNFKILKI